MAELESDDPVERALKLRARAEQVRAIAETLSLESDRRAFWEYAAELDAEAARIEADLPKER